MVLSAILVKNRKNGKKWDFGPCISNSPRYDIDMSVVFDKVDHVEFVAEEKTGNGSSFVRHFDEKSPEIGPRFANSRPPRTWGPQRCPPIVSPTPNTLSV